MCTIGYTIQGADVPTVIAAMIALAAVYFLYELRKVRQSIAEVQAHEARRREVDLCYWHAQLGSADVRMRVLAADVLDCLVGDRPDRDPAAALR